MKILVEQKNFWNIYWNVISGLVAGIFTATSTSMMIKYLGYEKYGVIGIWIMLQSAIQIFDYGTGAAVSREINKEKYELKNFMAAAHKFNKINSIALGLTATLITIGIYKVDIEMAEIIVAMVVSLTIQFSTLFYSYILAGKSQHKNLSKAQIFGNLARYGGAIIIVTVSDNLLYFFLFQITASIATMVLYKQLCEKHIEHINSIDNVKLINAMKTIAPHAFGMWMTSVASVALASLDRTLITLHGNSYDVGKYSSALVAAGLLNLIILPYYRVYYIEFSAIHFNNPLKLNKILNDSCAQLALIITIIGISAHLCSPLIFRYWLSDYDTKQIETFNLLIFGMGISGLMWLPGALCQATGKSLIHVWMMAGSLVLGTLVSIICIDRWGYIGATAVWIIHGLLGITVEMILIKRYVLNINLIEWYRKVFTIPFFLICTTLIASK